MKTVLLLCLISLSASAVPPKDAALVTLRGSLSANGKPVTAARFFLAPAESHTAIEVDKKGQFEVKAVASREYAVNIDADGYAPIRRTVSLDDKGIGELGAVKLEALKTAKVSVVVAPRGTLSSAPVQPIELRHGSCANVRAQDDSGCLLAFCAEQDGPALQIARYNSAGQFRPLGKSSLADGLAQIPRGTFVTAEQLPVTLRPGEVVAVDLADQYCGALLHVDELQ
jgi:hypothetical protein